MKSLTLALFLSALNSGPVRLVDVTADSGITFEHRSSPEKKYIVESMSGGVVVFDFDGDGLQDLYFVNSLTVDNVDPSSAPSHLYRNLGGMKFERVPPSAGVDQPGWGMGGCAGDYDGDGGLDLYVTALGDNKLYRNQGQSKFEDVTAQAKVNDARWSAGCAFGDYDGDGRLDLFVSNYVDFSLESLPEFGKGALCQYQGIPVQCGPRGLPGAGDSLFRNLGDGTFEDTSQKAGLHDPDGYYGLGVVWTDFDLDGKLDLFVANDGRPNYLYRNLGDGTFEDFGFLSGSAVGEDGSEQACMGVAVGDFNGDERFDLYATNFSNEYNVLYRNDGDWLVTDYSYASRTAESSFSHVGWGTFFFELDNDGDLDLFTVNGHVYPQVDAADIGLEYAQRKLLYLNQGDGTFKDISDRMPPLTEKRASRGTSYGDLDNDGDLDIVVNDLDGPPMLLRNDGGNAANWLRVTLKGASGDPFAFNARVKLKAGDKVQLREVRSGGSYLSQHDPRLHFGLGQAESVDWIEVTWPDGKTTRLESPKINSETLVEHPSR